MMIRRYVLLAFLMATISGSIAQVNYSDCASRVLERLSNHRIELEKVVKHFKETKDSLKLQATYFLICNMDAHYSSDYFWADSNRKHVAFDELGFSSFDESEKALQSLKDSHTGMRAVPTKYRDIDTVKAGFLIDNIDRAFSSWNASTVKNVSFDAFCEYILPYRISIEPLQNWRGTYTERFSQVVPTSNQEEPFEGLIKKFAANFNLWFTNTYHIETIKEPLPRLGALQLLHRKKGACENIVDLEVFTLRSQGIASTVDAIPYWATSSGSHFLNVAFDSQMKPHAFDVATPSVIVDKLAREPAKVLRITYSKQRNTLAMLEGPKNIPSGFLQTANYLDVTNEYWEVADVKCEIKKDTDGSKILYACVYNTGDWKPVWWGAKSENSVTFSNMSKGAVYLPATYKKNRLVPAGYPVAVGYNQRLSLKPDTLNMRTLHIQGQEMYVKFRPGKKYKLYYWDGDWVFVGEKKADANTSELLFEQAPSNALFVMVPEYSQKKERPFIVTNAGERIWF